MRVSIRPTHVLPVIVQTLLLSYWALHWPPLQGRLGYLVWCIPLAIVLDITLSYLRTGTALVGVGAVPVVLSATLFTNYPIERSGWMALVVGAALASKWGLRRSDGHIFNPSAFGLSLLAVLTLLGVIETQDVAHQFHSPPMMAEVVLLLALIPQLRVPIVLGSLGAAVPIFSWFMLGPLMQIWAPELPSAPSLTWSPVLLVVVLLLTDPATMPKNPGGRFLFGVCVGLGMTVLSFTMLALGMSDFWSKVLALPLVGPLVPWLTTQGARLEERWSWLSPSYNRRHVAGWVALALVSMGIEGKSHYFEDNVWVYQENRPPLLRVGADGVPTCDENPIYCSHFAFASEIRCWMAELGLAQERCGDALPFRRR